MLLFPIKRQHKQYILKQNVAHFFISVIIKLTAYQTTKKLKQAFAKLKNCRNNTYKRNYFGKRTFEEMVLLYKN